MASLKLSAMKLGLKNIKSILVTGGGSKNKAILQIIADIFDADVYVSEHEANSCLYGAAVRAFKALGIQI